VGKTFTVTKGYIRPSTTNQHSISSHSSRQFESLLEDTSLRFLVQIMRNLDQLDALQINHIATRPSIHPHLKTLFRVR